MWCSRFINACRRRVIQQQPAVTAECSRFINARPRRRRVIQQPAVTADCSRFINARRRLIQQPAVSADAAADNEDSSAAKRMKTMLQREAQSQFWLPPPHATSVSYTSQPPASASAAAAAIEEARSLSSTPSSTVSCPTCWLWPFVVRLFTRCALRLATRCMTQLP